MKNKHAWFLKIPIHTYLLLIFPTQRNYNIRIQHTVWKGRKTRGSYLEYFPTAKRTGRWWFQCIWWDHAFFSICPTIVCLVLSVFSVVMYNNWRKSILFVKLRNSSYQSKRDDRPLHFYTISFRYKHITRLL